MYKLQSLSLKGGGGGVGGVGTPSTPRLDPPMLVVVIFGKKLVPKAKYGIL